MIIWINKKILDSLEIKNYRITDRWCWYMSESRGISISHVKFETIDHIKKYFERHSFVFVKDVKSEILHTDNYYMGKILGVNDEFSFMWKNFVFDKS